MRGTTPRSGPVYRAYSDRIDALIDRAEALHVLSSHSRRTIFSDVILCEGQSAERTIETEFQDAELEADATPGTKHALDVQLLLEDVLALRFQYFDALASKNASKRFADEGVETYRQRIANLCMLCSDLGIPLTYSSLNTGRELAELLASPQCRMTKDQQGRHEFLVQLAHLLATRKRQFGTVMEALYNQNCFADVLDLVEMAVARGSTTFPELFAKDPFLSRIYVKSAFKLEDHRTVVTACRDWIGLDVVGRSNSLVQQYLRSMDEFSDMEALMTFMSDYMQKEALKNRHAEKAASIMAVKVANWLASNGQPKKGVDFITACVMKGVDGQTMQIRTAYERIERAVRK